MTSLSLSGMGVLVIEDEMMVSMLVEDMLSDMGCTPVGPATTIEGAVKLIEHGEFDVAILDVSLNGEKTYPIADALAARAIPFVFASGYSADGLPQQYRSFPLLQKPFQRHELEQALAAVLRQSNAPSRFTSSPG